MRSVRFCLLAPLLLALAGCEVSSGQPAVWVPVPDSVPVEAVAETLAAYGVVKSAERFADFARLGRKHLGIKPGLYPLRPGMPMGEVLVHLRRGTPPVRALVIRERITLADVAQVIERAVGVPAESLEAAAHDSALRAALGCPAETIEGYIVPARYHVRLDDDARTIVRQLADTFEARWRPEWTERARALGMTRHQLLTLASIVEGEMPAYQDRPFVASVYHNRLERGMRLQADPTVVYALGEWRRLSHADLRISSDYNTYLIDGLPPGPIGQSSVASIIATLYPPQSDYLYFVARADGRHLFSRSYREHLATIRQIRRPGAGAPQSP
jgi:UPF0755 protein